MGQRTVCFRGVDWLIGWDEATGSHCYYRNADFVISGDRIIFAGPGQYDGAADEVIPAHDMCIFPGLVDIHNHSGSMPTFRGVREDMGNPNFFFAGVYEGWGLFMPPAERRSFCTRAAICELLLSGVTTYVDMSYPYPGWVEAIAETGIRAYVSPLFDSAKIVARNDHELEYRWAPDGGEADYRKALDVLDVVASDSSGLLNPMVSPMTVDACTPELLRRAYNLALEKNWPYHLHAGMAVIEFHEMVRRTGLTSIQWLAEKQLLGPSTIIGHGAVLDHHSWVHWHTRKDIDILAESGASVSHCPVVLSRYGVTLESFGAYRRAGINIGIGTDCHPHNMLEEVREAAVLCRVAEQHMFSATTTDVFNAATIGGAKALMRNDIGRLAPGTLADFVVVDAQHPLMQPLYDPVRSLIFSAADRAVKDVYVGGRKLVENGQLVGIDHAAIAREVGVIQAAVAADMPNRDRKKRTAAEVSPLALPGR